MYRLLRGKRFLGIAMGILICLAVVVGVAAQGMGPTSTNVHVQNLSTADDASCVLEYVNQDGTVQHSDPVSIPASGSIRRDTRTDYAEGEIPTGWRGSLVIYCDQPVAAVSDQYRGTGSLPVGSSVGYSAGALQVDLPVIMCNWYGWDTNLHVQNAGSESTTVSVDYVPSLGGVSHTSSIPGLQPGASQSEDQSTMCDVLGSEVDPGELRFMGSVTLTADQPIVAVVNQENAAGVMKYTYDGFVGGSTETAAPLIMARHASYATGTSIQNRHAVDDAEVQITYYADTEYTMPPGLKGSTKVVNYTVGPGATLVRYEKYGGTWCEDGPGGGAPPYGDLCEYNVFVGSATIESTNGKPVVVIVNQESDVPGNRAMSYGGIGHDVAGTDVALPLVMYEYSGWLTGMSIQNLGDTQTTVTITYTPDPAHSIPSSGTVVKQFDIDPGEMLVRYEAAWSSSSDLRNDFTTFVGSARITSDPEKIAVIVNEDYPTETAGDWSTSYNGILP
jgi:hypothetical protein